MKLYKYCSAKAGIEIIRNSRVLLSHPSNFNDPFDCIFDIAKKDIEEAKELILNYEMFKGLYQTFHRNDLKLSSSVQKVIINGLKAEFDACKKLIQKTKTYEKVPSLNSSLKRLSNLDPKLKVKIDRVYTDFEKKTIDPIKMLADQALISCFSRRYDSILMWSHYSNSHKGLCIEIEEDRPDFQNVIYSKKRAQFDFINIVKRILGADFLGQNVDLTDQKYNYSILKPFFTKSLDWTYEEEVRCVISSNNHTIQGYELDDFVPYLHVNVSKIYVGINIKDDDLNEVLKLANTRGIPVVYMQKHDSDFALVIDDKRYVKPIYKRDPKLNPIELLFKEMEKCLDSNLYIPSLFIGLSIPGIIASVLYPNLNRFDGYVKVFRETYEAYQPQESPGQPYICGELCYAVKESLLNTGTINIPNHIKDFDIEKVKLKTEKKKNLNIFTSCITTVTHANGLTSNSIEINVREFCIRLSEMCKELLKEHKNEFDKLNRIDIFDIDKEYENMVECSISTKTINEQILNYARLKYDEANEDKKRFK